MLVRGVENVAYDELGEIELASGEKRRCKVLEINGNDALVQLFESATGINLSSKKVRFLGRSMELGVSERNSVFARFAFSWRTGKPLSVPDGIYLAFFSVSHPWMPVRKGDRACGNAVIPRGHR